MSGLQQYAELIVRRAIQDAAISANHECLIRRAEEWEAYAPGRRRLPDGMGGWHEVDPAEIADAYRHKAANVDHPTYRAALAALLAEVVKAEEVAA
ncbi:hypothetical protein [Nocardioides sp. Kera G14]|uniref:hypothetical protein n=1 Tax=Nocardioides sp. Kera G14 TaxID=2884264 RepID=UPI001D1163E1|nr:hypothetical protein [Nocardioides sp. Kera G14]UDY22399.1 hypothetical protein LH076_09935 [Nocardioides sp. Kera G14]